MFCPQLHLRKTLCSSWELFVQYLPGYGEQLCCLILECILSAPLAEYAADRAAHTEGAISSQALSQNTSHHVPDLPLLFILSAYCTISGKLCTQLWALLSSLALDKFLCISKHKFCLWYQENQLSPHSYSYMASHFVRHRAKNASKYFCKGQVKYSSPPVLHQVPAI